MSQRNQEGHPTVVRINERGRWRVSDARAGETFFVDSTSVRFGTGEIICHVRDYRYPEDGREFCIWSLGPEHYEVIA